MKKMLLIILVIVLMSDQLGICQSLDKVDSLKRLLVTSPEGNLFDVLWGLAYELYEVDNLQALEYAKQSNIVALRDGDSLQIVKSGRIMGQLLRRVGKLDESIRVLSYVLPISERHNIEKEKVLILNALAGAHTFKAEYDKALDYHFKSLIIREKKGDRKQISVSLINIGLVHFKLEDYTLALEYYLKALKIKEEIDYSYDNEFLLVNIGLCYNQLDDCENARKYFNKAITICGSPCSRKVAIEIEHGLGETSVFEKRYSEAELHFKRSFENSEKWSDQRYQLVNLNELAKLSIEKNLIADAKFYVDQAEALPDKSQFTELYLEIFKLKAELYKKSKDYKSANLFLTKYGELKDKIFDSEVKRRLMRVQTQFAERENLARIESQSNILVLQGEAIQRQKLLNVLIGAVAFLATVLVIVLYRSNRHKQRVNTILDKRVSERTFELEKNRDELKHSHDEKDLILKRVSSDLTSSWATLNGLSNLAAMELPPEQVIYFREAEATAERMINCVNKYTSPR